MSLTLSPGASHTLFYIFNYVSGKLSRFRKNKGEREGKDEEKGNDHDNDQDIGRVKICAL